MTDEEKKTDQSEDDSTADNTADKKTIGSQIDKQSEESVKTRDATSASRKELDEIEAKLQSIQNKLDEIKIKQGSERESINTLRQLDQKVLKDFKDKRDRKKTTDDKKTDDK